MLLKVVNPRLTFEECTLLLFDSVKVEGEKTTVIHE